VLLSHDQHGDNLDVRGRELLAKAPKVITTRAAKGRLGKSDERIIGLAPFETSEIVRGDTKVRVTGTPARHGPPLSLPLVGEVTGFVIEWEGQKGCVYITGDTVFYGGIIGVAARFDVAIAIVHLGCASWGPFRFTMNAREAETFASTFPRATLVPVHYEGWSHFKEKRADVDRVFAAANLTSRLTWLEPGVPRILEV
jgi:L-ascorbate metabolism protein UlaG (beta-lactamase superfamily)